MGIKLFAPETDSRAVRVTFGYLSQRALYEGLLEDSNVNEDQAHMIIFMFQSTFAVLLNRTLPTWAVVDAETCTLEGPLPNANLYEVIGKVATETSAYVDSVIGSGDEADEMQ